MDLAQIKHYSPLCKTQAKYQIKMSLWALRNRLLGDGKFGDSLATVQGIKSD